MVKGSSTSDPQCAARLALADRDSLIAVNTFLGDIEEGFWLRPNSIKAISQIEDPTSAVGWM